MIRFGVMLLALLLSCSNVHAALSKTVHTLQVSGDAHGTTDYTTGAITTVDNSLAAIIVYAIHETNDGQQIATNLACTASTGLTMTERLVADARALGTPDWDWGFKVYTAPVTTGASTTFTCNSIITATRQAIQKYRVQVISYTGYDTVTPVATLTTANRAYTTTNGSVSLTLPSSPASDSEVLGIGYALMNSGSGAMTHGADFTEAFDVTLDAWDNAQLQYRTASTSTTVNWADTGAGAGTFNAAVLGAIEIKAAAGGGGGSALPKIIQQHEH